MEDIKILTKDLFFRPGERVHIQMSNEVPDYIGILHSHDYIEVVYIISGSATHEIDGKTYDVKRGDLFIVNMHTPHMFRQKEDSKEPFVAYDLMFTLDFFDQSITGNHYIEKLNDSFMFYSLFRDSGKFIPYFSVSGSAHAMFGELFNKIYLEHRGRESGYIEMIRAYLSQLIVSILRLENSQSEERDSHHAEQMVEFVCDYIKEHFSERISVSSLAEKVYVNPDYLGRVFRSAKGITIGSMIQKTRIEQVCHRLNTTKMAVAEIASECGFDDVKFFYKVFKKEMGVLPGEYRKFKGK